MYEETCGAMLCNAMYFCILEIKRDNPGTCQPSEVKPECLSVTSTAKWERELSSAGLYKGIHSLVCVCVYQVMATTRGSNFKRK